MIQRTPSGKAVSSLHEEEKVPLMTCEPGLTRSTLTDQEFETRWEDVRRLLYVVCAIEGTDMLLLPSCYRAMEMDLGLSPSSLGYLAMGQAFWQASAAPLWGAVSDSMSRRLVLTTAVGGWAIFTALTSAASGFWVLFVIRCLNGIALASIIPVSQSIVADVSLSKNRGSTFGLIQSFTSFGQIFASLFGTWLSGITIVPGFMGWRLTFLLTGATSAFLVVALLRTFEEPPRGAADMHEGIKVDPVVYPSQTWFDSLTEEYRKLFYYLREVRSFVVIVLQGCFGTIPWGAFTFTTLWLQYIGFSDRAAGSLIVLYMGAAILGSVLGGNLGDWATRRWRYFGRPFVAVCSVAAGIPTLAIAFFVVPRSPSSYGSYAALLVIFGLVAAWPAVATNRPILVELVDSHSRASIIAWLTALEGSCGALFGPPMVGIIAERVFNYQHMSVPVAEMSLDIRHRNAEALSRAMIILTCLPWMICLVFYLLLFKSYKYDCKRRTQQIPVTAESKSPLSSSSDD